MFDCVLLIAGRGTRTKLDYNKAFYEINKKPLYIMALEEFLKSSYLGRIVIVGASEEIEFIKQQVLNYPQDKIQVVAGGMTRQDSVCAGVKASNSPYVLIHDGARPFIRLAEIEKVYHQAKEHQAAVLGTKLISSVKEVVDGYINKTISRDSLYIMQTPQAIERDLFLSCLTMAFENDYYGTDDVEIIEKFSDVKVKIVQGQDDNIKITTPFDLKILTLYEGE